MDWIEDDELDYEEDSVMKELLETGSKTSENSTLSGLDDQYLQLDCEDEEKSLFPNTEPIDNVNKESQSPKTESKNEANENHTKPNISEQLAQTNANANENENEKEKLTGQPEISQKDLINLNFSPKLPEKTRDPRLAHNNQQTNQNWAFPQNKIPSLLFSYPENNLQPLMSIKSNLPFNTLNPFSPAGITTKKLFRRRNKKFSRHFSGPFNKNRCKFQTKNVKIQPSGEDYNNWRSTNGNFKRRNSQNRKDSKSGEFLKNNCNNFVDVQYKFLKDDEKKLVSLKKEARLKRFSNDDTVRKDKSTVNSTLNDKYEKCLQLEEDYFKKMAEQKLIRERLLHLKGQRKKNSMCDTNQDDLLEKPNTYKASLLKKRNPFEEDSKAFPLIPESQIKQEKEIKKEKVDHKPLASVNVDQKPIKTEGNASMCLDSASQSSPAVKKETKFVRTVSKCFDELAFRKPKTESFFNNNNNNNIAKEAPSSSVLKTFPAVGESKVNSLITSIPSQQFEPQLTGCIVKVFNIPPSTTTNDILALCSSIGTVREVKLNFPKENSVVIRFVDPSCAEKFFSLYHGQKMNNYFLNVIIV